MHHIDTLNLVLETASMYSIQLMILLFVKGLSVQSSEHLKDLNVITILPMTNPIWPHGDTVLMCLNMALDVINNRTDILTGYKLNLIVDDDKVSCSFATGTGACGVSF